VHPVGSYCVDKQSSHSIFHTSTGLSGNTASLKACCTEENSAKLSQDVRSGQWPVLSAYSDNAGNHSSENVRRTTWL